VFRLSARTSKVFRVTAKQAVMSLAVSLGGIFGCGQFLTHKQFMLNGRGSAYVHWLAISRQIMHSMRRLSQPAGCMVCIFATHMEPRILGSAHDSRHIRGPPAPITGKVIYLLLLAKPKTRCLRPFMVRKKFKSNSKVTAQSDTWNVSLQFAD
jgi:hypothetical protein